MRSKEKHPFFKLFSFQWPSFIAFSFHSGPMVVCSNCKHSDFPYIPRSLFLDLTEDCFVCVLFCFLVGFSNRTSSWCLDFIFIPFHFIDISISRSVALKRVYLEYDGECIWIMLVAQKPFFIKLCVWQQWEKFSNSENSQLVRVRTNQW